MASRSDQPPADERTYDSGSLDAELFWHRHRTAILLGGAVILAIAAAVAIWFFGQLSARRAAEGTVCRGPGRRRMARAHLEVSKVDAGWECLLPPCRFAALAREARRVFVALSEISFCVSDQSSGRRRAAWTCREPCRSWEGRGGAGCAARGAGKGLHQLRCAVRCASRRALPGSKGEARGGTQGFRESRRHLPAIAPRPGGRGTVGCARTLSGAGRRKNRSIGG